MPLWDRPNSPTSGAASVATATGLNVQANQAGPLPATQSIVATEVKILGPENSRSLSTVQLPPDTANEQAVLDLMISQGYVKTTAAGTIAMGEYADAPHGNLLHKTAAAVTQNSATALFHPS